MDILNSGIQALIDYLTIQRALSLTIAFFLSGAIAQFMSQGTVMKYFGPNANKVLSYMIAATSGAILTVCSCSVLPMFASIRKRGAGIGPAIAFLFSGPAINILAVTFTFTLIAFDVGMVRVISAVTMSIVIGLLMVLIYKKSEVTEANDAMFNIQEKSPRLFWQNALFFITLLAILVSGVRNPIPTLIFLGILIIQLVMFFKKDEIIEWTKSTFDLAKKIVPLFIVGIFIAGVIQAIIPPELMVRFVGSNTLSANFIASIFGAFMYFATLTEVPIVNSFMDLGMLKGPATALLLAGPTLSLPNMFVISKVLGLKKTATYVFFVVLFSSIVGLISGLVIYL